MKLIKWVIYLLIFTVLLVIAAAAFVVTKVDPNDYKEKIASQVKQQTGRDLTITGDLSWSFYPTLGIEVGSLALENQVGASAVNMISAQGAKVQVAVMPLLEKRIEVGKIELDQPILNLLINEQGTPNWSDLLGDSADQSSSESDDVQAQAGALLSGLTVKGVNITNGQVNWTDLSADQQIKVSNFNLSTGEIKPGTPVDFEMSAQLEGSLFADSTAVNASGSLNVDESFDFAQLTGVKLNLLQDQMDANINLGLLDFNAASNTINAQALLYDGRYDVIPISGEIQKFGYDLNNAVLTVAEQVLNIEFLGTQVQTTIPNLSLSVNEERLDVPKMMIVQDQGQIELSAQVSNLFSSLKGNGSIKTNALMPREMLSNLGINLEDLPQAALQSLEISADYVATADSIALPSFNARVDESNVGGSFSIASFTAPAYRFKIDVDQLNVDNYLNAENQQAAEQAGPGSVVALPFAALKGLDVRGTLKIGSFAYQGIKSENLVVDADTSDNKITISPLKANLYGGESTNEISYDIAGDTPKMQMKTSLTSINLAPFLQAMQITDRFEGLGNVNAQINSFGLTSEEVISNMQGEVRVNLDDGAIAGANIQNSLVDAAQLYKSLKGKDLVSSTEVGDKTEFSNFSALVSVKNGVLISENIDLQAPGIRVKGRGNVDLNSEIVDLKMVVAVVDSLEGQGGKSFNELKGEELPLTITGTLSSPSIRIDTAALFKQQLKKELAKEVTKKYGLSVDEETGEQVAPKDVLKQKLKDEKAKLKKKLLEGLFGG